MPTNRSSVDADPGNRLSLLFTALFYGMLGLFGAGGLFLSRPELFRSLFDLRSLPLHAIMGVGLGGCVVLLSRLAVRRFAWAGGMEEEFRALLRDQPGWTIPLLALFSAVGEEIFFRGALQEFIGFWFAVAIFGVAHFPFSRKMWAWPLFALAMGAVFGGVTIWTGTLWMAIVAHGTINGLNMWMILRKEGEES